MESSVVIDWLSWVSPSELIDLPSLVQSIVAVPEGNVSVVYISSSINIETFSIQGSDSSSWVVEPSHLLVNLISPDSGNSNLSNSVSISLSVRDGIVSSPERSNRSGSVVECPPLSSVIWVVVLDSKSVLVTSDVLTSEESSVVSHGRFDLEFNSVSQWISWNSDSFWI